MSNKQEVLEKNFDDFEKTAGKAFQELFSHIEKFKTETSHDIQEEKKESIRLNNEIERLKEKEDNAPQTLT